jgi:hypothetical protein
VPRYSEQAAQVTSTQLMIKFRIMTSSVARGAPERIFSFRPGCRRLTGCVSCHLLIAVMILCAARQAAAERAIVVEASQVPFAPAELEAAIRMRVADTGAPLHVRVVPTEHGVQIEVRGGVRDVDLAGRHGPEAARLVALAADDLMLDDLAAPPALEPRREVLRVGLLGSVTAWDSALPGLALDITVPRDGWLAALDVGGATLVGGALSATAAVIRASAGVGGRYYELRGGLTLAPLFVMSGLGDQTVLVGAGVSGRVFAPLGGGLRGVLAAGIDAFATRTEYRENGMTTLTTPRSSPWLAAGVEVAW